MDHVWPWPASYGLPGCARGGRWASGSPDHLYRTTALRTPARRAVRNSVVEDECKAVGDQAALGVSRRVETLRLDRGVGRDSAIWRPEQVAAFEPPAVALGVEVGGQVARSLRLPARASGSTRQQVLIPGDSLARASPTRLSSEGDGNE